MTFAFFLSFLNIVNVIAFEEEHNVKGKDLFSNTLPQPQSEDKPRYSNPLDPSALPGGSHLPRFPH
jgi:hypothetical protein